MSRKISVALQRQLVKMEQMLDQQNRTMRLLAFDLDAVLEHLLPDSHEMASVLEATYTTDRILEDVEQRLELLKHRLSHPEEESDLLPSHQTCIRKINALISQANALLDELRGQIARLKSHSDSAAPFIPVREPFWDSDPRFFTDGIDPFSPKNNMRSKGPRYLS